MFVNGVLIREDSEFSGFKGEISIELHIIQAKKSTGFSDFAIQRLKNTVEEVFDFSKDLSYIRQAYDQQILKTISKFREAYTRFAVRFPTLRISYYYATRGDNIHENLDRHVKNLEDSNKKLFSSVEFGFSFIGSRRLLELARTTPNTSYNLILSDNPISAGNMSFICLVRLKEFYNFITDSKGYIANNLFEANVRDYQGDVQVNKEIHTTLQDPQGEDFWWLNNGIAIVASKATLSSKTLTIESPQIVNGLQTSSEIFKYFSSIPSEDDERSILIRVVSPTSASSRDRIIKATNSQTAIPIASLRATDAIHRDIEDFLKAHSVYYDRKKNYYKNEGVPISKIISITYLAQSVMSILLQRPDDARARPSTVLKDSKDYDMVFNDKYPVQLYLICIQIMRKVENFLRSSDSGISIKDINNIKFHTAMFAASLATHAVNPKPQQVANIVLTSISDAILEQSYNEVWSLYSVEGADDQTAKSKEFVASLIDRMNLANNE